MEGLVAGDRGRAISFHGFDPRVGWKAPLSSGNRYKANSLPKNESCFDVKTTHYFRQNEYAQTHAIY